MSALTTPRGVRSVLRVRKRATVDSSRGLIRSVKAILRQRVKTERNSVMTTLKRRLGLTVGAMTLAVAAVLAPAAAAYAGTSYQISGALSKNGDNTFFETGRAHASGAIQVNLKSWSPCGNWIYMSLRNGKSASATKVTETIVIKKQNTAYTFKKKGSTSTTIPKGTYYITAATEAAGCAKYTEIEFRGSINV